MKKIKHRYYFFLNKVEEKRLEKWKKKIKKKYAKYGSFTFKFTPTGIGDNITVYSNLMDEEKDITDYDSW